MIMACDKLVDLNRPRYITMTVLGFFDVLFRW